MIVGIQGGIGEGKTLVMTKLLVDEHRQLGKRLYANYGLKQVPYEPLVIEDVMHKALGKDGNGNGTDFYDCALGLDEAHIWLDSRGSQQKTNRLISYFLLQTGKLDVNLYYTTQDFGQVDLRLRRRTDVAITVKRKGDNHLLIIRDFTKDKTSRAIVWGPAYYEFYDTREVVKLTSTQHYQQPPQPRAVDTAIPYRDPVRR